MFTGLIEDLGEIVQIGKKGNSFQLTIASHFDLDTQDMGASISVDGVCLTVVELDKQRFTVDVSPETLERTTLQKRKPGDFVNLERALRISDRLGGHLVTGHIDGVGTIKSIDKKGNSLVVSIEVPKGISPYLIEKGSVSLDGISLTINKVTSNTFSVNIIPHTARITTIGRRKAGDGVNIETDLLGKYVEKFLQESGLLPKGKRESSPIDYSFLNKHGFA
ncbi:MAG TPA: riboflavin synthase [Thermodesulfobacteriota bacterium]|nr:riboflavin synthase [Thermodesulfobacteriota bacterium]